MNEANPKVLKHGDFDRPADTTPMFGTRVQTPKVAFSLGPSAPYEVSFVTDRDIITTFFKAYSVNIAIESDRVEPFQSIPYRFHFTPPGIRVYSQALADAGGMLEVNFAPEVRQSLYRDGVIGQRVDIGRTILDIPVPRANGLIRMAIRLVLSPYKPDSITIESLGVLILSETLRTVLRLGSQDFSPDIGLCRPRLATSLDLIEAELDEDLSLHRLADAVGLSVYHFAKAFKIAMGMPPRQYVIERRMARARDLLTGTSLSLADIAYTVGFSSQSHMTAAFSARLGVTPLGYREAMAV